MAVLCADNPTLRPNASHVLHRQSEVTRVIYFRDFTCWFNSLYLQPGLVDYRMRRVGHDMTGLRQKGAWSDVPCSRSQVQVQVPASHHRKHTREHPEGQPGEQAHDRQPRAPEGEGDFTLLQIGNHASTCKRKRSRSCQITRFCASLTRTRPHCSAMPPCTFRAVTKEPLAAYLCCGFSCS